MAQLRQVANPPNPFESAHREWLEPPPAARVEIYEERAKSVLSRNESPDIPFRWSCNPYRGCQHGCAYCYARTTHEYLGFGAGTDFESKLVVKVNAPELLAKALSSRKWRGESINFSGATDCYQPLEASYGLTRGCLEVCRDRRNPVGIVTKSFLIVRDVDLLAELHARAGVSVYLSIPFANTETCRKIEPQAPTPARRFEAVRRLREAGIPVGVIVAPIIPGLNDTEVPDILRQAKAAGADRACYSSLRLPGSVSAVFLRTLAMEFPLRARRIEQRIRDGRNGQLDDPRFKNRMRADGPYWESIRALFELWRDRLGLHPPDSPDRYLPEQPEPRAPVDLQLPLFDC
jgi:DNA repair photolyase